MTAIETNNSCRAKDVAALVWEYSDCRYGPWYRSLSLRGKQLLLAASAVALVLGGCAHTGGQRGDWGHGADFTPGWAAISRAAREAATDPYTWIPLAGAATLQIGDADDEISDWARREHPLFGSTSAAKDASDWLRLATLGSYAGIGLGAPGSEGQWWADKRAGFAVGAGTLLATKGITSVLKTTVDRTRPNGRNNDSFPSGHSSFSAASARLGSDALDSYDLTAGQRFAANAGLVFAGHCYRLGAPGGRRTPPLRSAGGRRAGQFPRRVQHPRVSASGVHRGCPPAGRNPAGRRRSNVFHTLLNGRVADFPTRIIIFRPGRTPRLRSSETWRRPGAECQCR